MRVLFVLAILTLMGIASAYDDNAITGYVAGAIGASNFGNVESARVNSQVINDTGNQSKTLLITATFDKFEWTQYGVTSKTLNVTSTELSTIAELNSGLTVVAGKTVQQFPGYLTEIEIMVVTPDTISTTTFIPNLSVRA